MSEAANVSEELDINGVIRGTLTAIQRNLAAFVLLAALLSGLPALIGQLLEASDNGLGMLFVGAPLILAGAVLLQGALIHGVLEDQTGGRVGFSEGLTAGLQTFLPLLGLAVLAALAICAGIILLIVPGIMLAVAWAVVAPVYVAERPPLLGAFGRSADLTRGSRWRIFFLGLIFAAVYAVFGLAAVVVVEIAGAIFGHGFKLFDAAVLDAVLSTGAALVGAVGATVVYLELRRLHGDAEPDAAQPALA